MGKKRVKTMIANHEVVAPAPENTRDISDKTKKKIQADVQAVNQIKLVLGDMVVKLISASMAEFGKLQALDQHLVATVKSEADDQELGDGWAFDWNAMQFTKVEK